MAIRHMALEPILRPRHPVAPAESFGVLAVHTHPTPGLPASQVARSSNCAIVSTSLTNNSPATSTTSAGSFVLPAAGLIGAAMFAAYV